MKTLHLNLSKENKDEIKRQYEILNNSTLYDREYKSLEFPYSDRDEYQRDYARVLYSSSFRRLQGKMQILGINSSAFYRNRLTHSLEVAQIAKSIAFELSRSLGGSAIYYASPKTIRKSDLFCLEAAALCHDIGHPAFGHSGERVLDKIAQRYGKRFEGNAQNFRVLRTLDKYDPQWKGLNLTNRTLLATNKYIVSEKGNLNGNLVDKFMFTEDFNYLCDIRQEAGLLRQRTLDVQIIELADDIAYAVHDLEDALAYRSFNIDELRYVMNQKTENNTDFVKDDIEESFKVFDGIIGEAKKNAGAANSYRTLQEFSQVFRKKLVSLLTDSLVHDITMKEVSQKDADIHGTDRNMELCLGKLMPLCSILKKSIFECATRDEDITLYEKRGEIVITSLFNVFADPNINVKGKLLPPDYRNPTDPDDNIQGSIDFIAGMMDTFAILKYEELFNKKFNEIPVSH